MRPSTEAWLAVGAGVLAYDLLCPSGETLSEACDRAIETHPVLTLGLIGATALHLANAIPQRFDPFAQVLSFVKGNA